MIATLEGVVSEKLGAMAVINVHGVGYGVLVAPDDFGSLATGKPAKLYVYEHIREAAHDLYGFMSLDTKQLFEQLLEVNGVGPKMALNVLSIGSGSVVRASIASGDVKTIQQANGVGKRVAERIVVELKDKVGLAGVDLATAGLLQSEAALAQDEAAAALIALGYTPQDAAIALKTVPADIPTQERIKQALKGR